MPATFVKNIGTVGVLDTTGIGGSSFLTIPGGGVPAGNTLLLALSCDIGMGVYSITDSASGAGPANTWGVDRAGGAPPTELWRCTVTRSYLPGDTIEISHPAIGVTHGFAAACREYAGVLFSEPLDRTAADSGYGNYPSATTVATRQADELVVGAVGWDFLDLAGPAMFTRDASLNDQYDSLVTGEAEQPVDTAVSLIHDVVSATGTQTVGGTLSLSRQWCVVVATYKTTSSDDPDPTGTEGNFLMLM